MFKIRVKEAVIPRIATLDLMRGYFLIAIILNHLHFWPSGYDWLTARGELFVSSAEGFFLISGIVLGIVRGRKLLTKPFKTGARLLLNRALQLYIVYVTLGIAFTLIGWQFISNPGLKEGIIDPSMPFWQVLWRMLSFQYLYGWADYLRLYIIFLVVSPLFLLLLRANLWHVGMLCSILVWFFAPSPTWPQTIFTQPYHWQLLFFSGMTIGFHWPELQHFWTKQSVAIRNTIITILLSTAISTLAYNLYLAFGGYFPSIITQDVAAIRAHLQWLYFDKENLPFLRLMLFSFWFWASFWLFKRYEKFIQRWLGWLLEPLGTNSLYVYIVHAVLVLFIHLMVPAGNQDLVINFVITTLTLTIIWLLVRYKVLFSIIPR